MKKRLGKNLTSEHLIVIGILVLLAGIPLFYFGERNVLTDPSLVGVHKLSAILGQSIIIIANPILFLASTCFVLEGKYERWKRLADIALTMAKSVAIIVAIAITFYFLVAFFSGSWDTAAGVILSWICCFTILFLAYTPMKKMKITKSRKHLRT